MSGPTWPGNGLPQPVMLQVSGRDTRSGVDSIEWWSLRLMDGASLFNEVNPRSVAAIFPVAGAVVGL